MIFDEWYAQRIRGWSAMIKDMATVEIVARDAWDASRSQAIFEANSKLGDEGNEAEKDARRKVAVDNLIGLEDRRRQFMIDFKEFQRERDAIIKEAQG